MVQMIIQTGQHHACPSFGSYHACGHAAKLWCAEDCFRVLLPMVMAHQLKCCECSQLCYPGELIAATDTFKVQGLE